MGDEHTGLRPYRFKDNPEERAFAEAWHEEQRHDHGLLGWLLGDGSAPVEPTTRDCLLAATVIQWLGSPVGQAFLRALGWEKKS